MKIKAYLYFPDTDVAFQNLHNNPDSYTEIVKELYAVKFKLKQNTAYEIYYDSANVSNFLDVAKGFVTDPYLTGIKNQLLIIIGKTGRNVNLPNFRNHQFTYANWTLTNMSVFSSPFVIAESAEDSLKDSATERTICICLGNSVSVEREEMHIIKDVIHLTAFPNLINVTATNSDIGFVKWMTTLPVGKFLLKGNLDYEPLEKFWKKERIYRHIPTGYLWYFDFNHKDNKIHYEVFDSTGNAHLGEVDENGSMEVGTESNTKKISNIL